MTTSRHFKCVPQILGSLSIHIQCIHAVVLTHHLFITMFCWQHGMFPKNASSLMLVRYFSFINREEINYYHRTTRHIGQYFTLSAKIAFEWTISWTALELWEERSKILFNHLCNFLSPHVIQERVSFSKVNTGAHENWIYDRRVYLQNLLHVAMRVWCETFLFADLFLPYFISRCLCFNILCVKSFRLMEQHKQIIGKLTCKCIEGDIFREEQITWNTTLLRIKLAGGFESSTQ